MSHPRVSSHALSFFPSSTSRIAFLWAAVLLTASLTGCAQPSGSDAPVTAYVNGQVWTGDGFTSGTVYVQDSLFVERPAEVDTTIDVEGGFLVPPFGDAHTHMLADSRTASLADSLYVQQGIFYALVLTNPYERAQTVVDRFESAASMDVAYAHGGITSTGSHPAPGYERRAGNTGDSTWTQERNSYWFMDTPADVREKWGDYLAQSPDVVKTYLLDAQEGMQTGDMRGHGLRPDVLELVVDSAHAAGKRVFAHVGTPGDVQVALDAGVDALAHLPGFSFRNGGPDDFRLSEATIRQAGEQGLALTPTSSLARLVHRSSPDTLERVAALQREMLQGLREAGAEIALGADIYGLNARRELEYMAAQDLFDDATLLTLWAETTPQVIFPDRKIGRLQPGYEASFLVLGSDPTVDVVAATKDVRRGVKQGETVL